MAAESQSLPAWAYERIYVALQAALDSLGRRAAGRLRNLSDPDTVWALAVLLGRRAYYAEPGQADYRTAKEALGFLGTAPALNPLWALLVKVGNADTGAEFDAAAGEVQAALATVSVDILTAFLTPTRLAGFRTTAATLVSRPEILPTRQSVFDPAVEVLPPGTGKLGRPAGSVLTEERERLATRRSAAMTALVYGAPMFGGLLVVLGGYRLIRKGKR